MPTRTSHRRHASLRMEVPKVTPKWGKKRGDSAGLCRVSSQYVPAQRRGLTPLAVRKFPASKGGEEESLHSQPRRYYSLIPSGNHTGHGHNSLVCPPLIYASLPLTLEFQVINCGNGYGMK